MSKSAVVHARMEPATKRKAENILNRLGLSPTEAIRLFYRQISLRDGLPFPVLIPNKQTMEALRKSRAGNDLVSFDSLDDMFASWEK